MLYELERFPLGLATTDMSSGLVVDMDCIFMFVCEHVFVVLDLHGEVARQKQPRHIKVKQLR